MYSLCAALYSHPVLALPDFIKPFCIESDASDTAVGSVFAQKHVSIHKPIVFLSKILRRSVQNSSVNDHKLLVIVLMPIYLLAR